jgi:pimeloyl-ACP methyl ester carboxylesterase
MNNMDGFIKLAPAIWLREPSRSPQSTPPLSSPPSPSPPPSLVVLCTWVGARPKHIAKYAAEYLGHYPSAALLVLESNLADMTYRSDGAQQARLGPARHVLQAQPGLTGSGVVVHAFSNGGAQCATQVVAALPSTLRATALRAFILDSCPSEASYTRSANAILLPLADSPMLKLFAFPFTHLLLCLIFIADRVFGFENVVARARRRLNSSAYIPHAVPRLYIYSSADRMVPAADVEAHAEQARRAGCFDVANLRFEVSGHCAHASRYAEQYWCGIARFLDEGNVIAPE